MEFIQDPNHKHNFPHRGTAVAVSPGQSIPEQLEAAGLNWRVELVDPYYLDDKKAPIKFAIRDTDKAYIDSYKTRKPWQNEDILSQFNEFCAASGLQISHVGFLPTTWSLFAVAPLPELLAPPQAKNDLTEGYLFLTDSHIRGTGLTAQVFANRLACTNGMLIEFKSRVRTMAHFGEFQNRTDQFKLLLEETRENYHNRIERQFQLADIEFTYDQALLQLIAAFGIPGLPLEDQPNKAIQNCIALFDGGAKGSELLSAYNTAYGLLQSVSEYFNHGGKMRGGNQGRFTSLLNTTQGRGALINKFEKQLVSVCLR